MAKVATYFSQEKTHPGHGISALLRHSERVALQQLIERKTMMEDNHNETPDVERSLIIITNAGLSISSTNYWGTRHADAGLFFLSGNAGAWRLLVPDMHKDTLAEMATTKVVEIELGFKQG